MKKKKRSRSGIAFVSVFSIFLLLAGAFFIIFDVANWQKLDPSRLQRLSQTSTVYDANNDLLSELRSEENRRVISLEDIPRHTQLAFIAAEDLRFYTHKGIDFYRILGALKSNLKSGALVEGASTITQQLAKLTHLSSKKTIRRKLEEIYLAFQIENTYTKDEILEFYLNTVYFGGGTPTTLTAAQLDRLLTCVEEHFDFSYLQEYTVEAGRPDSITREKLEVLKKHNVGRISINPQTMKQETLNLIGRHHTVEQIKEVYEMARELGFDNINMDLILGLPGETIDDVRNTMAELKEMAPDNITVHSLAIKRAARLNIFWEKYAHMSMENSDDTMAVAAAAAEELGLKPYYLYRQKNMAGNLENVGYAAEGKEGIYNILIMEEKQSIVAIGAGATTKAVYKDGRIERANNVKDVELYLQQVDEMIERKKKLFADFL